ncbi:restriction endonuclease subunit S [Bacillus thuringiensis]|uniref:restriction endonuclease subunit S n=1 Tax=Bacillus thuringiensis TaxID=1428 RepID=UPI00136C97A4|nr:restriction endonuclease subunit S [Bacillus thuringiensis]MYW22499.1 restriction endonuclease subunit S [Bacillus thuringiensis]
MSKVFLGDVAKERKETCKGSKNGYPIVGLEHLIPEEITLSAWEEEKENTFKKLFHGGDVLFGRRRAYLKKAVVAPFKGICSGDITVIEAIPEKILPELLPFVIQNDALFDFAVGKSAGSLSPRVKWEHLKNYEFELPDMEKQRELAKVLWIMDATKKSYQKLLLKTDELVKAQFMELFKETERVRLDVIAEITMGQSPSSDSYNTDGQGMPFYQGSADFSEKYVKTRMYCTSPTRIARAGDILMSVRAPVGTVNLTDKECCIGRGLAAIRSKKSPDYNEFLLYAFRVMEEEIASMGQGSTVLSITKDKLHSLSIPNAEKDQQKLFIAFAQQSDKSKFELQQAFSELTATYKKILSENLG